MSFSIGLGLIGQNQRASEPIVTTTEIDIDDFIRDRTLFDSGVAVGRNFASVSVSGIGTPNEAFEYRVIPESGAPSAWTPAGTIETDGSWALIFDQVLAHTWMRVEVRVSSEPWVSAFTSNRFGVGHVVALWGQSEVVRIRSQFYDSLTPPALVDEDSVQFLWFDGSPQIKHLTNSDPHTTSLAEMANVFMSAKPGEKFAIVMHAVSGTGFRSLVDDADTSRLWADELQLHNFATADGQNVGIPSVSWFASPGSLGSDYEEALTPLFAGVELDGTPVSFPSTVLFGSGQSYQADHWFGELYNAADTRWVPFGPHRFDISTDMQNATVQSGGASDANLVNKQAVRESWRQMVTSPNNASVFLPLSLEPMNYVNGFSDGAGGWTDYSHPSGQNFDGTPLFAGQMAYAILQSTGMLNFDVPEFDNCTWDASGDFVEVWSSQGDISTLRMIRAETPLDSTFNHWTDIFGWEVNGAPAERAELVAGRVRIYPNGGGKFTSTDVISFGAGGGTGMIQFPEDAIAQVYKNYPIVDLGLSQIEGVPVRPLPSSSILENTLPPEAAGFVIGPSGPYFVDSQTLGLSASQLHFRFELAPQLPASGGDVLVTTTGNYLKLETLPNGRLRLRVVDGAGNIVVNNAFTASGTVASGVFADLVLSIDLAAGYARIFKDGTQILDQSFSATTPEFPSNRIVSLMAASTGGTQSEGTVSRLSMWKITDGTASDPVAMPYKELVGPPSLVNSDPWKNGDNAT